ALVADPFGVAGGLAGGEPGGDGLAGDLAGELVVGAVRAGRAGLAAAAGLAAVGVAAGEAAGQGEAGLAEPGGQGLVAAAQMGQVLGHVVIVPRVCAGQGLTVYRLSESSFERRAAMTPVAARSWQDALLGAAVMAPREVPRARSVLALLARFAAGRGVPAAPGEAVLGAGDGGVRDRGGSAARRAGRAARQRRHRPRPGRGAGRRRPGTARGARRRAVCRPGCGTGPPRRRRIRLPARAGGP